MFIVCACKSPLTFVVWLKKGVTAACPLTPSLKGWSTKCLFLQIIPFILIRGSIPITSHHYRRNLARHRLLRSIMGPPIAPYIVVDFIHSAPRSASFLSLSSFCQIFDQFQDSLVHVGICRGWYLSSTIIPNSHPVFSRSNTKVQIGSHATRSF